MAWTELTRRQHARTGNRYASDLTDAEWAVIADAAAQDNRSPPHDAVARCF